MKKLILFIAFVGSLFADSITHKEGVLLTTSKENVKYLGVSDNKVYFEYVSGRIDYIPCKTVKEVLDSDGKIISVDCKLNENIPTEKSRSNLHKTDKQYYSRNDLIAAGNLLIDFKDEYYRGALISSIGLLVVVFSYMTIDPYDTDFQLSFIGELIGVGVIGYGNIIQYLSFRKAADAGKELIQAGHKIDSEEKDSNFN